jgi:hypothetical protein
MSPHELNADTTQTTPTSILTAVPISSYLTRRVLQLTILQVTSETGKEENGINAQYKELSR